MLKYQKNKGVVGARRGTVNIMSEYALALPSMMRLICRKTDRFFLLPYTTLEIKENSVKVASDL